jgi:hypothetical protein
VVDVCATGLADAVTYTKGAFESVAFAAAAAPVLDKSLTPPLTKAYPFLEKKDPEPKEAEVFTCKICPREYGGKRNYGFCGKTCRDAQRAGAPPKKARKRKQCEHGRPKNRCKDCGAGYCQHGRQKHQCKDCGVAHCEHGRPKNRCSRTHCGGAGYCQHGRLKYRCKDCGTGYCQHGRQRGRFMEC